MRPWKTNRAQALRAAALLSLLLLVACGDRGEEGAPSPPRRGAAGPAGEGGSAQTAGRASPADAGAPAEAAELGRLLARAAAVDPLSDQDRAAIESAARRLLEPAAAACDGCAMEVAHVGTGGAGYLECRLYRAGEVVAELELFYRPGLPAGVAESWGRRRLGGHPASGWNGRHLFVWPGRFEIRAFARDGSVEGEERLAGILGALPLDGLAEL